MPDFGLKTISAKAVALVVLMCVISIAATTAFLLWHFAGVLGTDRLRQNADAAEMIINPGREAYSVSGGKLYAGSHVLNGNEAGVDAVASAFGGVATIFLGDTRIATNITQSDGSRAVGTKLAAGAVYDAVLGQGQEYLGAAKILDGDYVTAYKPLKDASGTTIGILFVGFERNAFNKEFATATLLAGLAALVLVLVCGGAGAYCFLKLFAPFEPLSQAMADATAGRFADRIPFRDRTDEFGELACVIEKFQACFRERETQRAGIENIMACFKAALEALARRDLTHRLTSAVPAAYQALQNNFNAALAQLEKAMQEIESGADDIAASAAEIDGAAREMAARTEREAAALEETSAAVNQLLTAVNRSAEGAVEANDAAGDARAKAESGCGVAKNAVEAIRAMAQSSSEITQIISVINDIAFQTNLLALNAGVEAARAGEAGKGFAVVASEVRALAQRSAEAAKQIKQLIVRSEEQVETGVRLVEESGDAFDDIVSEITTVHTKISAITNSSYEQAAALRQIEESVQQLDQTTQKNAAMAEQSCAACDEMAGHAQQLAERVGQFRTSGRLPLARVA